MKRKNYIVRIKLIFETTMDHSQTSMKKAQEDVNRVLTDYLKDKKLNILNLFEDEPPRLIVRYPFRIIHHELGIKCRFYDLRGSFATISLRNGCEIKDIAEVLGHKRIETTRKYYITSLEENKRKVTKIFEDEMKKV